MRLILKLILIALASLPLSFQAFAQDSSSDEIEVELESKDTEFNAADFDQETFDQQTLPDQPLVEQEYIAVRRSERIEDTIPRYKDRRSKWGALIALTYSLYKPASYVSNFTATAFDDTFDGSLNGLFEATVSGKWNSAFGSVSLGLGAGYFSASSSAEEVSLRVIPVRVEASLMLDTLLDEPLVAPYVLGGAYVNFFKETQSAVSFNGNTQVSPYFGVGANLQLNWLDRESAINAYLEHGLENTFVYLEGRQFVTSGSAQDPDFGTGFQIAAGAKFEY